MHCSNNANCVILPAQNVEPLKLSFYRPEIRILPLSTIWGSSIFHQTKKWFLRNSTPICNSQKAMVLVRYIPYCWALPFLKVQPFEPQSMKHQFFLKSGGEKFFKCSLGVLGLDLEQDLDLDLNRQWWT